MRTSYLGWGLAVTTMFLVAACPERPPDTQDAGEDGGTTADAGADAGRLSSLLLNSPMWAGRPRLSPDGTRVAFTYQEGGRPPYQLATVDLDGGNLRILVQDAGSYLTSAAWGPDGGTIYWTGGEGVRSMPAGGGASDLLYRDLYNTFIHPDVSRAGDFMVWGVNGASPMRFLDLQNRQVRPFAYDGNHVRISPEGSRVAFSTGGDLRVIPIDGGSGTYLLGGPSQWVIDGGYSLLSADWLPDGQNLAVATERGLEIINIADPTQRTLLWQQRNILNLDVSDDGRLWIFAINGEWPLYLFRPDAG